jgi:hypothetical protein
MNASTFDFNNKESIHKRSTIIRVVHNRENPYVQINKNSIWDSNLSLKAVGLHVRCMSFPNDWKFSVAHLSTVCKEGIKSLYGVINELIENNYVIRFQKPRLANGRFAESNLEYIFFEIPLTDEEKEQYLEELKKSLPHIPFRHAEKRMLLKNKNTNLLKKENIQEKKKAPLFSKKQKELPKDPHLRDPDPDPIQNLTTLFFQALSDINPKILKPDLKKWKKEMKEMIEVDGRSLKEVKDAIGWLVLNDKRGDGVFTWSKAVNSPQKLRKHFSSIWLEMTRKNPDEIKKEKEKQKIDKRKNNKEWAREVVKSNKKQIDSNNNIRIEILEDIVTLKDLNRRIDGSVSYDDSGFKEIIEKFLKSRGFVV